MRRHFRERLDTLYTHIASLQAWLEESRHKATVLEREIQSLREEREGSASARFEREALTAVLHDAQLASADRIGSNTDLDEIPTSRNSPIHIAAERQFRPGRTSVIECPAPKGRFTVVFSDDGEVGYFYALDTALEAEQQIRDALHVYDVADAPERVKRCAVRICWTRDGTRAALLMDGCVHAVFDFLAKEGCCRSGFPRPPSNGEWSLQGHAWDEALSQPFE